jgi:putative ABC transport system permease protein
MAPVTAVAAGTNRPYSHSVHQVGWQQDGRQIFAHAADATDGYAKVMGIEMLAGRWFEPADGALDWEPVVITRDLAVLLFGDEDPLGRRLGDDSDEDDMRVVGVIETFRNGGELSQPNPFRFTRMPLERERSMSVRFLLMKVAPGTTAAFEEPLMERLEALAPEWSFTVDRLESERADGFRAVLLPLGLAAVVAGFLLLMVVLGLTGVMWQNVTRRTREIGLRRAVGASRAGIQRQVVAEVMVTAAFGLLLGVLLVLQLPVVEPMAFLSFGVVLSAAALAVAFMLLLAAGCGLYPGWSATRIEPAEALHYE